MQISKTLLTGWAIAFCAGTILQAAPDTEAQAKAREALRQKLAELEAQSAREAPAAPTPAAAHAPPLAAAPAPTHSELAPPPAVQRRAPEPASGSRAPVFAEPALLSELAGNPRATPEQIERSREAVRQRIAELSAQGQFYSDAQTLVLRQPKLPKAQTTLTEFDPIPAPPSSLSASKQAQLAELLKQYLADALTPEKYHTERARILAEP